MTTQPICPNNPGEIGEPATRDGTPGPQPRPHAHSQPNQLRACPQNSSAAPHERRRIGKRNKQRLEAACQVLLNQQGLGSYSTIKRIIAGLDSDAKAQQPVTPAARTAKTTTTDADAGSGVQVRSADHYSRSHHKAGA